MIIQFCGLSGSGKSTLARSVATTLKKNGNVIEILDGDEYRESLCRDLGFSKQDRSENIRRLAFVANKLSTHGIISIICAINPYDEIRKEVARRYKNVFLIHVDCSLDTLFKRDTKGLYMKAFLPDDHPNKINNLTGVNDPFEAPLNPDLYINTEKHTIEECCDKITAFILANHPQLSIAKKSADRFGITGAQPLRPASL